MCWYRLQQFYHLFPEVELTIYLWQVRHCDDLRPYGNPGVHLKSFICCFFPPWSSLEPEVVLVTPSWGPSQVSYLCTEERGARNEGQRAITEERWASIHKSILPGSLHTQLSVEKLRLHSWSIWTTWWRINSSSSGPYSLLCNELIRCTNVKQSREQWYLTHR